MALSSVIYVKYDNTTEHMLFLFFLIVGIVGMFLLLLYSKYKWTPNVLWMFRDYTIT